jgi:hypothetical protein
LTLEAGADYLEVVEYLPGLHADVACSDQGAGRVEDDLAGNVDDLAAGVAER